LLTPLLGDKVRAVRMEAARALADLASTNLTEYVVAEHSTQPAGGGGEPRPDVHGARRYECGARAATSLKVDPRFVPAFVNLASSIARRVATRRQNARAARRRRIDPSERQTMRSAR
jgi:hypothetical protein